MLNLKVKFTAMFILAAVYSCTPLGCIEETVATAKAGFYRTGSEVIVAPDSVTIFGIDADTTALYSKALKQKSVKIPLNASSGNCSFAVRINGIQDTVRFKYSNYPHLVSKECGITYFHYLDSIVSTGNIIDTVIIINNRATTGFEENIRIFY